MSDIDKAVKVFQQILEWGLADGDGSFAQDERQKSLSRKIRCMIETLTAQGGDEPKEVNGVDVDYHGNMKLNKKGLACVVKDAQKHIKQHDANEALDDEEFLQRLLEKSDKEIMDDALKEYGSQKAVDEITRLMQQNIKQTIEIAKLKITLSQAQDVDVEGIKNLLNVEFLGFFTDDEILLGRVVDYLHQSGHLRPLPEEMVLVPVEPTEEMQQAYTDYQLDNDFPNIEGAYKAMIAATKQGGE